MDDGKRSVLVAALSAYADLLAKNTARLELEEGKGKGKASDDDVDLKAEVQDQIKHCGELTSIINNNPAFGKELGQTFDTAEHNSFEALNKDLEESNAAWKGRSDHGGWTSSFEDFNTSSISRQQRPKTSHFYAQQSHIVDNEPLADPFTGLPIISETGYEAGPSNRPPPPLRRPPRPPPGKPLRPPPKPAHLRSSSLTQSGALPPQRPAPPPPEASGAQELQRKLPLSTNPPEHDFVRMNSLLRKPVAINEQTRSLLYQPDHSVPTSSFAPPDEQTSVPATYRLVWETDRQDGTGDLSRNGIRLPNTSRGNYMRHIAELASKAIKAAGDKISLTRTPSVTQGQPFHAHVAPLHQRYAVDESLQLPEYTAEHIVTNGLAPAAKGRSLSGSLRRSLSMASVKPSRASRKSSLASISSAAESSIFTASPSVSSPSDLWSPASSSTSFGQGIEDHNFGATSPKSPLSPNSRPLGKRSSWNSIPPMFTVPENGSYSPDPPKSAPGLKRNGTWTSSVFLHKRSSSTSLASPALSPGVKSQMPYQDIGIRLASDQPMLRRASSLSTKSSTFSSEANKRTIPLQNTFTSNLIPSRPATSSFSRGSTLYQDPFPDEAIPEVEENLSAPPLTMPNMKPSFSQQENNSPQSRPRARYVRPGSNNPYKDHMAADEAFAKALQQQEYEDIQIQRDMLLAYAVANGMAEDDDIEIAYYMKQDTDTLIASTAPVTPWLSTTKSSVLTPESPISSPRYSQSYNPPPGPPPSHSEYTAPPGPPPSHSEYTPPAGPPPSRCDYAMVSEPSLQASMPIPKDSVPPQDDLINTIPGASVGDDKTTQLQLDMLEALEIERQLKIQDLADGASLAEAKRLQAEMDAELRAEEASWEDYKKSNIEECIVCGDEQHRDELLRPCEHGYCEECLQEGFKNALTSRTPLKCCKGVLSIEDCTGLEDEFVDEYEEMMLELTTPNPMYCSNARCAKFLPPSAIVGDVGSCKTCNSQTCRHCRNRLHPGSFCAEDKETEAVKELARKKGWKTCPGCNHLIERSLGCLHMVCSRCTTAFCYRCSKPWKDCESTCPDAISATHPKF